MKPFDICLLLLAICGFVCVACQENTVQPVTVPPLECEGEGSYKFAECETCCMYFHANMGNTFDEALDSLQNEDKLIFQDVINRYDIDFDESYLHFDTLHVLNFTLDERLFIQVWYYAYIKDYKEAMPLFDYGVVDTKGDVYHINYPND